MIRTNKKMNELIRQSEKINLDSDIKLSEIKKIFFCPITEIRDCIVIDIDENHNFKLEKWNDEKIFKDKTGFEAKINEINLNRYVEIEDESELIQLALMLKDILKWRLKNLYPQHCFKLSISVSEGDLTIRVHVIREDEEHWISGDLEEFKLEGIFTEIF